MVRVYAIIEKFAVTITLPVMVTLLSTTLPVQPLNVQPAAASGVRVTMSFR